MTLCRDKSIVKIGDGWGIALPLCCRSWNCEYCEPQRKAQLIALGFSGHPNRFVTLTVNPARFGTAKARAAELSASWRTFLKRWKRWQARVVKRGRGDDVFKGYDWVCEKCRKERHRLGFIKDEPVDYLAVFEATKAGEPHLHLLVRSGWICQGCLSRVMDELMSARIVYIEKVEEGSKIAFYVAKYCGKEPGKFGTLKRYWHSKNWCIDTPAPDENPEFDSLPWVMSDERTEAIYREWRNRELWCSIDDRGVASFGHVPGRRFFQESEADP